MPSGFNLEHFQKYCSHSEMKEGEAVFLGFGVVSALLTAKDAKTSDE
jgi:hypothetical protein